VTAALILAAGLSSRMGRPKALLEYQGRTFIETIIATVRDAAIGRAVVAVSPTDDKIIKLLDLRFATVVVNSEPSEAGPIASIRSGVREIVNQTVESLLVWSVDQPHVAVQTIRNLDRSFKFSTAAIAVPVFEGLRGHPVIFGRNVFNELLDTSNVEGARTVVRRDRTRVLEVSVDDPAVLDDIDTPEDYQRLISSTKSLH
jgi:molybdenum cofactor cytidylyltransferase